MCCVGFFLCSLVQVHLESTSTGQPHPGFHGNIQRIRGLRKGIFPSRSPLGHKLPHSLFCCFEKCFKEGAGDRHEASWFTWLEHAQSTQGSSSSLARMGHLERVLLTSSIRFKSLGGVILLGGAVRSVEQNLEMALGRPPAWMLLEMLLHGGVGTSLLCRPPTLAGKAGPMKGRETCCTPGLVSEGGCS